jgi:hypothetical protein
VWRWTVKFVGQQQRCIACSYELSVQAVSKSNQPIQTPSIIHLLHITVYTNCLNTQNFYILPTGVCSQNEYVPLPYWAVFLMEMQWVSYEAEIDIDINYTERVSEPIKE